MATDVERLAVLIEANTKSYENAMKKLQQQTDRTTRNMEKRFKDAGKRLESTFSGIGSTLTRTLGTLGLGVGGAQAIRAIANASQEYVKLQNALRVTGLEGQALENVMGQLFQIAQRQGTAMGPLVTLYGRASLVQKELKISTEELLQFTDKIALALRVSGQSAEQSSGALLQLSQALGSGVVRAEEFNSILEGALPIAQAAAEGIEEAGGSVAKLRQLVVDGKVSSEAFFKGFQAGSSMLEQRAAGMQLTVGQATENMASAFTMFIGKLDETFKSSKNAAENIDAVGKAIAALPGYIDAASKGLSDLQGWLNKIATNPFWTSLSKSMGLKFTGEELDSAIFSPSDRQATVARELLRLTEELADAQQTAGATGLAIDRERVAVIEQRIAALRTEKQVAADVAFTDAGEQPLAGAPRAEGKVALKDFPVNGKDKKTKKRDPFERAIDSANKRIAVLNAETATIGMNTAARERARIVAELEEAAKAKNAAAGMKNTEVTEAQRAKINEMADAMQNASQRNYELTQAFEAQNSVMQFAGEQTIDLIKTIGGTAEERANALKNVLNQVIDAMLKATLLGEGPLAGIFGTKSATGGVGGIFGLLAKTFAGGFATGGTIPSGKWGIVGERGPEFVTSGARPLSVTPNMSGGPQQIVNNNYTVHAPGATPEAMALAFKEIRRLRAEVPTMSVAAVSRARELTPGRVR